MAITTIFTVRDVSAGQAGLVGQIGRVVASPASIHREAQRAVGLVARGTGVVGANEERIVGGIAGIASSDVTGHTKGIEQSARLA